MTVIDGRHPASVLRTAQLIHSTVGSSLDELKQAHSASETLHSLKFAHRVQRCELVGEYAHDDQIMVSAREENVIAQAPFLGKAETATASAA
ncbi:hypothetical protein [Streptomyces alboflavus]|uniref:hypothetical protein n=1 Tax=Streptomyces alboflavus TaxID=67267 RepID=UPI0004CD010A